MLSLVAKIRYRVITSHPTVVDVLKVAIIKFTPADTHVHACTHTLLKTGKLKTNEKLHRRNGGGVALPLRRGREEID